MTDFILGICNMPYGLIMQDVVHGSLKETRNVIRVSVPLKCS